MHKQGGGSLFPLKVLSASKLDLGDTVVMGAWQFCNWRAQNHHKTVCCLFEAVRTLQSHFLRQMMPSAQDGRLARSSFALFHIREGVSTYFQYLAHKCRKVPYLNCFTWTASGTTMAPDW